MEYYDPRFPVPDEHTCIPDRQWKHLPPMPPRSIILSPYRGKPSFRPPYPMAPHPIFSDRWRSTIPNPYNFYRKPEESKYPVRPEWNYFTKNVPKQGKHYNSNNIPPFHSIPFARQRINRQQLCNIGFCDPNENTHELKDFRSNRELRRENERYPAMECYQTTNVSNNVSIEPIHFPGEQHLSVKKVSSNRCFENYWSDNFDLEFPEHYNGQENGKLLTLLEPDQTPLALNVPSYHVDPVFKNHPETENCTTEMTGAASESCVANSNLEQDTVLNDAVPGSLTAALNSMDEDSISVYFLENLYPVQDPKLSICAPKNDQLVSIDNYMLDEGTIKGSEMLMIPSINEFEKIITTESEEISQNSTEIDKTEKLSCSEPKLNNSLSSSENDFSKVETLFSGDIQSLESINMILNKPGVPDALQENKALDINDSIDNKNGSDRKENPSFFANGTDHREKNKATEENKFIFNAPIININQPTCVSTNSLPTYLNLFDSKKSAEVQDQLFRYLEANLVNFFRFKQISLFGKPSETEKCGERPSNSYDFCSLKTGKPQVKSIKNKDSIPSESESNEIRKTEILSDFPYSHILDSESFSSDVETSLSSVTNYDLEVPFRVSPQLPQDIFEPESLERLFVNKEIKLGCENIVAKNSQKLTRRRNKAKRFKKLCLPYSTLSGNNNSKLIDCKIGNKREKHLNEGWEPIITKDAEAQTIAVDSDTPSIVLTTKRDAATQWDIFDSILKEFKNKHTNESSNKMALRSFSGEKIKRSPPHDFPKENAKIKKDELIKNSNQCDNAAETIDENSVNVEKDKPKSCVKNNSGSETYLKGAPLDYVQMDDVISVKTEKEKKCTKAAKYSEGKMDLRKVGKLVKNNLRIRLKLTSKGADQTTPKKTKNKPNLKKYKNITNKPEVLTTEEIVKPADCTQSRKIQNTKNLARAVVISQKRNSTTSSEKSYHILRRKRIHDN